MRVPPWWVRRLLIAPLMPVLGFLALVAFPFVVAGHAAGALVRVLLRRGPVRWRLPRVWLFGVAYLLGETVCLLCCLLLWVAVAGRTGTARSQRWHLALLRGFLAALVALAGVVFRFRLQVHEPVTEPVGTRRLDDEGPVLVLGRHAGPGASFVLVHLLLSRYGRVPRVVLTERLRLDPSVDVLLTRLGSRFIARGGDVATAAISDVAGHLGERDALVLFPEGGDWTPTRHRLAVDRLRRKGLLEEAARAAAMPHVLPPRPAGTAAALAAAPDAAVVIVGHTGHDDLRDLQSIWAGLPLRRELDVVWWHEPASVVPTDPELVDDWLFVVWDRIDGWIQEQDDLVAITRSAS